jgi:hypothetical protein
MFEVKNGKVSVARERVLTAKQLMTLSKMSGRTKAQWLATLLGISKERVWVPRIKSEAGRDVLAGKSKNSILNMLSHLTATNVNHAPTRNDLGQWVGVEIECFIPAGCSRDDEESEYYDGEREAKTRLRRAIEDARIKRCQIKGDGSLSCSEGYGIEITLLINTKFGWTDLEKLCSVLSKHGCYVNRTCGLHVHFDARAMEKAGARKFGRSIGAALPILSKMVPPSRRANTYCRLGVSRFNGDRYYAVNLTAFRKYGTVEIRLHSGTTDLTKIRNWIELLQLVGNGGLTQPITDLQVLMDRLNMPDRLIEYVERRTSEFTPPESQEVA